MMKKNDLRIKLYVGAFLVICSPISMVVAMESDLLYTLKIIPCFPGFFLLASYVLNTTSERKNDILRISLYLFGVTECICWLLRITNRFIPYLFSLIILFGQGMVMVFLTGNSRLRNKVIQTSTIALLFLYYTCLIFQCVLYIAQMLYVQTGNLLLGNFVMLGSFAAIIQLFVGGYCVVDLFELFSKK